MPPETNEKNHIPEANLPKPYPSTPETTPDPRLSIHTLEGDIFAAIKDENYSNNIVKIAAQARTPDNSTLNTSQSAGFPFKKIVIVLSILIATLAAGAVAYYMLRGDTVTEEGKLNANATTTIVNPTLIEKISLLGAEAMIKVDIKNLNKFEAVGKIQQAQRELRAKKISQNTAVELDLGISSAEFFQKNQYSGGEGLLRSLAPQYSFGLFNTKADIFESFIVLKIADYELMFASMLEWEGYLPIDFKEMFTDVTIGERLASITATSTATTSTSTLVVPQPVLVQAGFKDAVLKNTDARVYRNRKGEVEFVYGFINKDYLIITGGIDSFVDIKTRLLNRNILR